MPRTEKGLLCRHIGCATSLMAFLAFAGCSNDVTPAPPVHNSIAAAAVRSTGSAIADDAFRAAANCQDCTVIARSAVTLPLTGKTYVEAKLTSAAGSPRAAAVDIGGNAVAARDLLAAEGKAKRARQGNLRDVLYSRSLTSSSDLVPVSIWADFGDGHELREQMASDAAFRAATQAHASSRLHAATSKVTAWLDAHGFATHDRGTDTPLITADVPVSALADLGRVDGTAVVDLRYPEVPNGLTWFDAVKGPAAQMMVGSAAGISFCNGEGTQPYSSAYLSIADILDSNANVSHHMQWTSELISATANTTMAPGATFDVPAFYRNTGALYTEYQAWSWCFSTLGVNNMNVSAGSGAKGQVPLTPEDMAKDYYAYHWPYPFITLSAGNCHDSNGYGVDCVTGSPDNGSSVDNRSYNGLVVGASDPGGTADTSNDVMASFSQYLNPGTTHDDFELPNLVAPGDDEQSGGITSASGISDTGTSASSPIVMGTALLMRTQDVGFNVWPEMMRATILAASTHPVDGARPSQLGTWDDLRQGAGLLNADVAVAMASPAYYVAAPNNSATSVGRTARTYDFSTDFPGGVSAPYNISIAVPGRLRVVIAWDATAQFCQADGSQCQGDVLDADLDLKISKYNSSTGTFSTVIYSTSWDSSWEMCDIAVNAGDVYKAELLMNATNSPSTWVGIAWNNYMPENE